MKVNHNMSAVITNKQLLRTENKVTEAMERLSSGLKINHSKDNPAGMAISNKLNLQIEGLDQASQNASDGISVLQTTDGALNEVTSLIQRMRELSVQAASDSNTPDDKKAIQQEVEELKKEINRVSKDTEFNTKSLLDGSIQRRVYGTNATRMAVSSKVPRTCPCLRRRAGRRNHPADPQTERPVRDRNPDRPLPRRKSSHRPCKPKLSSEKPPFDF